MAADGVMCDVCLWLSALLIAVYLAYPDYEDREELAEDDEGVEQVRGLRKEMVEVVAGERGRREWLENGWRKGAREEGQGRRGREQAGEATSTHACSTVRIHSQ